MELFLDAVIEDGQGWLDAQKRYVTLAGGEKLGRLTGALLIAVVSALFITAVLFMAGIALAIWLGRVFGDLALGFLAVAGILMVLGVLFYVVWKHSLRDRITLTIVNAVHEKD